MLTISQCWINYSFVEENIPKRELILHWKNDKSQSWFADQSERLSWISTNRAYALVQKHGWARAWFLFRMGRPTGSSPIGIFAALPRLICWRMGYYQLHKSWHKNGETRAKLHVYCSVKPRDIRLFKVCFIQRMQRLWSLQRGCNMPTKTSGVHCWCI